MASDPPSLRLPVDMKASTRAQYERVWTWFCTQYHGPWDHTGPIYDHLVNGGTVVSAVRWRVLRAIVSCHLHPRPMGPALLLPRLTKPSRTPPINVKNKNTEEETIFEDAFIRLFYAVNVITVPPPSSLRLSFVGPCACKTECQKHWIKTLVQSMEPSGVGLFFCFSHG